MAATVDVGIIVKALDYATGPIRGIVGEMKGMSFAAVSAANGLRAIQVVLAGIAIQKMTQLTQATLKQANSSEILQTQLALINGDFVRSGRIIDDLNKKYDALGVSGDALAETFVKFRQIGQTDQQAELLTDTIAKLNAATERTPEQINAIGEAFRRMLAKGTVDQKQFISQIVDQVPVAASVIAEKLGARSVEELGHLVKAGHISGEKFVEAFINGIQGKFGKVFDITKNQISTGLNQVTSVFSDTIRRLELDTTLSTKISGRLNDLAAALGKVGDSIDQDTIDTFFNTIERMGATIGNLSVGMYRFGQAVTDVASKVGIDLGGSIDRLIGKLNTPLAGGGATVGALLGLRFGLTGAVGGAIVGGFGGAMIDQLIDDINKINSGLGGGGVTKNGEPFAVAPINNFKEAINNVEKSLRAINPEWNKAGEVIEMIAKKSKEAGLSLEQTSALIAHARAESRLGADLVGDNGHSFGLFQFNDKGELKNLQNWAQVQGKNWMEFGTQIEFVIKRFKELGGASTQTAEDASKVMNRFERFKDFLNNGDGGIESQKRIQLAQQYTRELQNQAQVFEQIANRQGAPTSGLGSGFAPDQEKKFEALNTALKSTAKSASDLFNQFSQPTPVKMVDEMENKFESAAASLQKMKVDAQDFLKTLKPEQTDAIASVKSLIADIERMEGRRVETQKQHLEITKQIGQEIVKQSVVEQQILQLKAQEAQLQLQTQFSTNTAFNILSGMSGGQIAVQTAQQQLQLKQQILGYELQIAQLQQQYLRSTDPETRAAIQQTIGLYQQLTTTARTALENLSASSVAQRQMWQSVGQSIEQGAASALTVLITRTGSLKDVTLQMYNAITQAAIKYLLQLIQIKAIMPFLGSFGGGGGGILGGLFGLFGNGGVIPGGVKMFANGGIIGGPTLFGMAGEAGKEAIMPLETVNGKLGVRAVGAGGDTFQVIIQAIDTQTGTEFLMKNIDTIQRGFASRRNINRGIRLGVGV